jgi:hypothetical protein
MMPISRALPTKTALLASMPASAMAWPEQLEA